MYKFKTLDLLNELNNQSDLELNICEAKENYNKLAEFIELASVLNLVLIVDNICNKSSVVFKALVAFYDFDIDKFAMFVPHIYKEDYSEYHNEDLRFKLSELFSSTPPLKFSSRNDLLISTSGDYIALLQRKNNNTAGFLFDSNNPIKIVDYVVDEKYRSLARAFILKVKLPSSSFLSDSKMGKL